MLLMKQLCMENEGEGRKVEGGGREGGRKGGREGGRDGQAPVTTCTFYMWCEAVALSIDSIVKHSCNNMPVLLITFICTTAVIQIKDTE